jgi:hypothetical protein
LRGVQVGGLNVMQGCGLQVGAWNIFDEHSAAVQIGGLNLSDDGSCFQIGVLNFHNGWITTVLGWSFK